MNILKQSVAFVALFLVLSQTAIHGFAAINSPLEYTQSEISSFEKTLNAKIRGSEKIITKINTIVSKLSTSQLKTLKNKLEKAEYNLMHIEAMHTKREEQTLMLINYIILKLEEKELLKKSQSEDALLKEYSQTLSDSENKEFNTELVKVQKQLLKNSTSYLEALFGEFEKYSNYEETGDFSMNFNIDHELVGKIEAQLELNDYTIKNSNFDTQITTKVKALVDAIPRGEEVVKLEFSAIMDFILKDQNYYVLLEKLNIVNEQGVGEIEEFLEKIKEIAAKNKYIHFEDENTAEIMRVIQNLTPQNILSQGNTLLSQPMFRAYKKEGNKYYLIPTKYACDTIKELSHTFDPFNGTNCTESQYEDILGGIAKTQAEIYMELGTNTTLGFTADGVDQMEQLHGDISFSSKHVTQVNLHAKPDQKKYPNESATLEYKRNSSLNGSIYANAGEIDMTFSSTLDRNNRFSKIDSTLKAEDFNGDLQLNNHKINGKYNFETYSGKILGTISGKTNQSNILSLLNISNQVVNSGNSSFNNISNFDYNNGEFSLTNNYSSDGTLSEFELAGDWDSRNNMLTAGKLKLLVQEKESSYDYNTYKRIYSGDFKDTINSNLELKNKNISGNTLIYNKGVQLLAIEHSGRYEKNYFEMNNAFEGLISPYFFGNQGKDTGNINVKINTKGYNNNGNIFINIDIDSKKILEFELDNTSTKIYKMLEIKAPRETNTVELEDIIEESNMY